MIVIFQKFYQWWDVMQWDDNLSPLQKTETTPAFFHSGGNWPVSEQDLKRMFKVFQMDLPHIFNMQILSISWSWDLFGSRFLIIFSMSFISKVMKDKNSFDFREHSDEILLVLFVSVYCFENWELKISAFCLNLH